MGTMDMQRAFQNVSDIIRHLKHICQVYSRSHQY